MLNIGCHLSSSKGYMNMAREALSIGASTFQFFTRNPRGGAAKPVDEADCAEFSNFSKERGIGVILAHAPYTINPCAARPEVMEFALQTMADDLRRLEYVPGNMYNFHPGSHVGQGSEEGVKKTAATLNAVMWAEMRTTVLIETMAGKGSEIGATFREVRDIIDRAEIPDKLGVCLDTCHVFDGGYDIVGNLEGVLEEFDRVIGLERLKAIHINDSKNPLGSHKDRHEVIGGGKIGLEAFGRIVNHPALRDLPFYLETPNDLDGYKREIELLRGLQRS
ncbi:MAG: deoxyribonuclease IV [Oscillospiraceae bacterium]|nr:deoxyribonuclease IV [Oscillospiraceae bacterium]